MSCFGSHPLGVLRPATITLLVAFVTVSVLAASSPERPDFEGWFEGAAGLEAAARQHERDGKPVFVYFYTDWCPYCQQFERELLSSSDVDDYLDRILAVRINPESGPREAELGRRYRVRGYPSLYVHSAETRSVSQIDRMVLEDGKPVLMTPGAFIDVIKTAGAR